MISAILTMVLSVSAEDSLSPKSGAGDKKAGLTKAQSEYLATYCKYRVIAISYVETVKRVKFEKSANEISPDDIRPHLAQWLSLPKDAKWEDLMQHERVRPLLTEEHREKFSRILCNRVDGTWLDILKAIESLRKQRDNL